MNLLVKDICMQDTIKRIINQCVSIIKFVNNHSSILNRFNFIRQELRRENCETVKNLHCHVIQDGVHKL